MGAAAVTNFEYEDNINAKKAQIKLLKKDFVSQVIKEFRKEMGRATSTATT